MEIDFVSVGKKIRLAREKALLSLQDLASKTDIAITTLYRIEHGKSGTFKTYKNICDYLNIDLNDLF